MEAKRWSRLPPMSRRRPKNKQEPARLPESMDLCEVFGGDCPPRPNFANELDAHLVDADLQQVLLEKSGRKPATQTLKERLRAYPPPREELDLHGTTGAEVAAKVSGFLNAAATLNYPTVRIITGKGLHTEGPAVLPPLVEATLSELKQAGRILHYAWDKKRRERSGAVVVYLK